MADAELQKAQVAEQAGAQLQEKGKDVSKIVCHVNIHTGNEDAFCDAGILVFRGLETLTWSTAEAVEIEAVIPVGTANQGETMRPLVIGRIVEGTT